MYRKLIAICVLLLAAPMAHAYVGPGLGLGVIGAVIGGIVAVFLAIVGVIWYPIKRLIRKLSPSKKNIKPTGGSREGNDRKSEPESQGPDQSTDT